jgi:AraC family transcriptional regulator
MAEDLDRGSFYGATLSSRVLGQLVMTERSYPGGMTTPVHSHEHPLLCLVLNGAYEERHCGKVLQCTHATSLFHAAYEEHREHFTDYGARSLLVEMEPAWVERNLHVTATCVHSMAVDDGGVLLPVRDRLYREFVSGYGPDSDLVIESVLSEIMADLFLAYRRESRRPAWLLRAVDLIHERFPNRLTLAEIAEQVGVHPVYLAQSFRRFYGCTIGDHLRRLRIDYACKELVRSDTPLIDVAITAGFSDQSHFTRTFKRAIGVLPSEYRVKTRR